MATEEEEKELIGMLEGLNSNTLTLHSLENVYNECVGSPIAMVFLADILFRIVRTDLLELCCKMENLEESLRMKRKATIEKGGEEDEEEEEEEEEEGGSVVEESVVCEDVCIDAIVQWIEGGVLATPCIALPILRCFLPIAYALAHAYANPNNSEMGVGSESVLSWQELQGAASAFLSISHPRIVDALPVIRCLRRKPLLDCRGLSPNELARLAKFDKKWERLCNLYPVVNMLADPALVIVDAVGGGGLPPHVAVVIVEAVGGVGLPPHVEAIIAATASASNNPLPSGGGAPVHMADVSGECTNLFQFPSMEDALMFADMLRLQLVDATGEGGRGPAVRILSLNAPPISSRLH